MHLLAGSWWNLWARKQKKLLEGGCVFAIFSVVKHTFYEFQFYRHTRKNSRICHGILDDELVWLIIVLKLKMQALALSSF